MQRELVASEGALHTRLEVEPRVRAFAHRRVEERALAAAGALGGVHGDSGLAQQCIVIAAVAREQRDADAGGQRDLRVAGVRAGEKGPGQPLGELPRGRVVGQPPDQSDELVAAEVGKLPGRWIVHALGRTSQHLGQLAGNLPQCGVAGHVAEHVVDAPEVVEVQAHHRHSFASRLRRPHSLLEPLDEAAAGRQAGDTVGVAALGRTPVTRRPAFAERGSHLPDLVRMERLVQVEQAVGRGHATRDVLGIHVRICGADDNVDLWIDLADALRRPQAVRPGRHAHVQEHDCVRPVRRTRRAHLGDGSLCAAAVGDLERAGADRRARQQRGVAAREEQAGPQFVERRRRGTRGRRVEHAPVGVEHRRLVVDHQDARAGRGSIRVVHAARARSAAGRCSGTVTIIVAPSPSLAALMPPPIDCRALAHQCRPMPWLVVRGLVE